MTVDRFPRSSLLPRVQKPVQYVGGELNATVKDWDSAQVRWALMYPDAYEVGLPNQGVMILYEVLNERPDALAERTYAIWPDLEALMREHGIPQFTVDGHRPVGAFDVLGVSFATELGYTNLLAALDLAGIPLAAADRDESHPIVLAGGHAAFNRADRGVIDARCSGRRQAVGRSPRIASWKAEGAREGRRGAATLARTGGVTCRALRKSILPTGHPRSRQPPDVPFRVHKRTVRDRTSGSIRSSRWSRWPSQCMSGVVGSSAAAPGAPFWPGGGSPGRCGSGDHRIGSGGRGGWTRRLRRSDAALSSADHSEVAR